MFKTGLELRNKMVCSAAQSLSELSWCTTKSRPLDLLDTLTRRNTVLHEACYEHLNTREVYSLSAQHC
jgi:hypothetical protein